MPLAEPDLASRNNDGGPGNRAQIELRALIYKEYA